MAQFARPNSDILRDQMLNEIDGDTDLYLSIDETSADDGDYIYGDRTYALVVGLSTVPDPAVNTGHKIKCRGYTEGGTMTVQIRLREDLGGGTYTDRAEGVFSFTGSVADFEYTLSGAEADAITDYSALTFEIIFSTQNGLRYVTQAYLEVPDAPASKFPPNIFARQAVTRSNFY